ncbi:DJ-1/PfpI family protein [Psychrobacter okhotskensis]|uniref:DJ-1/PfpI family protein n=1 Tax=Psychrobacter TaxID=497 RepID=UPI000C328143|nr:MULTISPECIES: DJ-1/PfpI family protein [Psychrobacter]NRD70328.1 DJ-1/PfpI family protein [Psychrobacter okhotskensis]PKG34785.1 dimethyladenosine transferase [Psychrobacter sp. Sarcosine-3u-12]
MHTLTALLFDDFETLDLFGPIEMFGCLPEHYRLQFASLSGGIIRSKHGVAMQTVAVTELAYQTDIVLMVGGMGTRQQVYHKPFLQALRALVEHADWALSVCTGSALLAKAGVLDGKRATSNKLSWQWVISQSDKVDWVEQARWVVDGKFYTSSGVSAGMDMALGFITDRHDIETARQIAHYTEYRWQENSDIDDFYRG